MDTLVEYSPLSPPIPKDILEDLCSRFLINIPEEERNDLVRICFQIELAHWFYLDFFRQEVPTLPACGMQQFLEIIFSEFPFLNKSNSSFQDVYQNWKKYKLEVPVFGAILLDESLENCILVRGFHKRISWGFPKGKVNKDEDSVTCAIREVEEETGFDITDYIDPSEYIQRNFHDHMVQLYIVPAIPFSSNFQPKTRGEIEEIKWFNIDCLPAHKKDTTPREKLGLGSNAFFLVQPFVKDLRKWVAKKKEGIKNIIILSNSINNEKVPSANVDGSYQVIGSETEDGNEVISEEQEKRLRKRKEEEQRRFQEIHSLTHPLREGHSDNEKRLKDLLGWNDSMPAKSKKAQKVTDRSKSERRTEDQPKAIRKLLTGTVDSSPHTQPERTIGQGFGSPNDLFQGKRENPSVDLIPVRKDVLSSKQPIERAFIDNEIESAFSLGAGFYKLFPRNSPVIERNRNVLDPRRCDDHKGGFPYESFSFTGPSAFRRVHKDPNISAPFITTNERNRHQDSQESWSDSSSSVTAFVNFKFDKEALLATLPTVT